MKGHLTGFGLSAVLHAAVLLVAMPWLLWQDKLSAPDVPVEPVTLALAQFVAPPPEPAPPAPVTPAPAEVEAPPPLPEPKPEPPKPVAKPKPKPVEKPKPPEKPKPKPEKKREKPTEKKPVTTSPSEHQREPVPVTRPPIRSSPPVAAAPATSRPTTPAPARQAVRQSTAPPAQATDNRAAEAAYKARLQSLIATRKKYPRMAEKAEVQGSVGVSFTVMPNGAISGVRVTKSSGNDWLDQAAVQAVNAASGALPFPPDIRKAQWAFSLTVNFKLDW